MSFWRSRIHTGHNAWPVLLMLALVVVVPTACVLWFMSEAMKNERLAVRQKLADLYRGQLLAIRKQIQSHWQNRVNALNEIDRSRSGPEIFAHIVNTGLANSAILYDDAGGQVIYPTNAHPRLSEAVTPEWTEAQQLEHRQGDPAAAAGIYAKIAEQTPNATLAGRALQARARCLSKAGQTETAIEVLAHTLADDKYRHITDPQGRLIQPGAQLRALQLMGALEHSNYGKTAERLARRLTDYSDPTLLASQRRFLMRQLQELMPDGLPFPTLAAEDLALAYLKSNPLPSSGDGAHRLRKTRLPDVWQLPSPDGVVIALFTPRRILSEVQALIQDLPLPADVSVILLPPETDALQSAPFASVSVGEYLPGWELGLRLKDQSLFDSAADEQIAAYLWTGILFVATILIFAAIIARYVARQIRLTRLKNDLIATVSHELKTPLSSMRVLVDTLLDGHYQDERRTREYLQLISKENTRLSHLIDNFLTFSRMERNKHSFTFTRANPANIATSAIEAIHEKFESARFRLEADIAPDLPAITVDSDALITVVLNLLDNAYKYSGENKHVILRAYEQDNLVCLEVEDQGIGLSSRDSRKIFDRFYQVDQSLARATEGCGLGLNIVDFIIKAHGGTITVNSQPGKGSTFTVRLPAASSEASGKLQRSHA